MGRASEHAESSNKHVKRTHVERVNRDVTLGGAVRLLAGPEGGEGAQPSQLCARSARFRGAARPENRKAYFMSTMQVQPGGSGRVSMVSTEAGTGWSTLGGVVAVVSVAGVGPALDEPETDIVSSQGLKWRQGKRAIELDEPSFDGDRGATFPSFWSKRTFE